MQPDLSALIRGQKLSALICGFDSDAVKSIPCVRTYENDLGRLTIVGDVDLDQALTAAAAGGGEAADEQIAHGLDAMVAERVFPGHSDEHNTISTCFTI
ncbi:hypothetical protein L2E82_20034 [Cichorium intybus]|uniref:Uncharacterized protein n=1 Tax=Cichorium intybus TaxID=13427 RepID=A0ACB9DS80_CICIN|nr:hypothetical protein L2E82_20034 [Cichorium intybus]